MLAFANVTSTARDLVAAHATFTGETVLLGAVLILIATSTVARASNVATVVTGSPHQLLTGCTVDVTGVTSAGFNAPAVTVTVVNATTFTYASPGSNLSATPDTGGRVRAREDQLTELALRTAGHAVTVFPLLDGQTLGRAPGRHMLDVGLALRIAINPEIATKNIHVLIRDAVAALTVRTTEPNDAFKLAETALQVDDSDPGLLSYLIFFNKQALL